MNNGKKWIKIFNISVMVLTVVLVIYFAFKESSVEALWQALSSLNKWWILLACFFMLLNWFMDGQLIYAFTKMALPKYRFRDGMRTAMVGQYFNSITPFASGGQPMQIFAMTRQGVDAGVAGAALVQKFIVWQSTLTLASLIFIIFRYQFFLVNVSGFMVVALGGFIVQGAIIGLLLLFSLNPKITHWILKGIVWLAKKLPFIKNPEAIGQNIEGQLTFFHENVKKMLCHKRLMLRTFLMTALQLFSTMVLPYCIYRAFNLSGASLFDMLAANAFLTMIVSFVPLPGAAGASEGGFLMLFSIFFTDPVTRMPAVLLWRIISFYSAIAFGAPFARIGDKEKKKNGNSKKDGDSGSVPAA